MFASARPRFFASCAWVAGRAVTAAINLRGAFRDGDVRARAAIADGAPWRDRRSQADTFHGCEIEKFSGNGVTC
jgi:hypothetical protein